MDKQFASFKTVAGTNYVIHYEPQPMADGTYAPKVIIAKHLNEMVEEFPIGVKGNLTYPTEQEAAKAGLLAGSQWVSDLG